MGLTVLYLAFGIVALWLLGEVLLQYKARLRFRLLAFVGFLGVVLGVLMHSVVVIGLGAAAFTVGQTYVTLSFRQGFAQGWAINGRSAPAKPSKRRRGEPENEDPSLEVSDLDEVEEAAYRHDDEYAAEDDVFTPAQSDRFMPPGSADPAAAESTAVYEPQPLPEDTGSYGVYNAAAYAAATDQSYGAAQSQDQQAYAAAAQSQDQQAYATGGQSQDQQAYAYDGYTGYDQQQYGYDNSQQQYAAYSDPYVGQQTYTGASYDTTYTGGDQQYTQQQQNYGQDQYATGTYGGETPPGGVWVPQQRTDEQYGGELPPEQQQYPYQGNGNNNAGYDEQYRF
ncbi:SCO2102 family sporulation regulator [Streptomyces sp. NPDC005141]